MSLHEPPIINFQMLPVPVSGPGDVDRLLIFTGVAEIDFGGVRELDTGQLELSLLTPIEAPDFGFAATTYLALSSVAHDNRGSNYDWEYELGQLDTTTVLDPQVIIVNKTLKLIATVVCDEYGPLSRLTFQVCALASSAKLK
jgi:hypothetical protein